MKIRNWAMRILLVSSIAAAFPVLAQQAEPHQRREPVPGGGNVPEAERGELAGGQHPVHGQQADQVPVPVGQVPGRGQHRCLILGACPRPGPARVRI